MKIEGEKIITIEDNEVVSFFFHVTAPSNCRLMLTGGGIKYMAGDRPPNHRLGS